MVEVAGDGVGRKSSNAMWDVKGGQRESKTLSAFLVALTEQGTARRAKKNAQDATQRGVVTGVDGQAELLRLLLRVRHLALQKRRQVAEQAAHREFPELGVREAIEPARAGQRRRDDRLTCDSPFMHDSSL